MKLPEPGNLRGTFEFFNLSVQFSILQLLKSQYAIFYYCLDSSGSDGNFIDCLRNYQNSKFLQLLII